MRCVCLALLLAMGLNLGWSAEINISFADYSNGATPPDFKSMLAGSGQPGVWTVVSDEVAPLLAPLSDKAPAVSRRMVLGQTSQDPADERFPVLVYEPLTLKDFKLTTHFKIVSGIAEQMAGVVFRFQNASNFYVFRVSALGHNARFYKMVNGLRSDPIGPTLAIAPGAWHSLSVQCNGNQISLGLDGSPVMPTLGDNTFPAGKVGFWTKSDAVSYFSDLQLEYTPEIPAAQALLEGILAKESHLQGLKIYTLDPAGHPRVLASSNRAEIGQIVPANEIEAATTAITNGTPFYLKETKTVAVWLPYRDRNGDPIAAVWVRLKSFFGETRDNALTRGTMILKLMQDQITSREDLLK